MMSLLPNRNAETCFVIGWAFSLLHPSSKISPGRDAFHKTGLRWLAVTLLERNRTEKGLTFSPQALLDTQLSGDLAMNCQ